MDYCWQVNNPLKISCFDKMRMLSRCISTSVSYSNAIWLHPSDSKLNGNYIRLLCVILNNFWKQHPSEQQLHGHFSFSLFLPHCSISFSLLLLQFNLFLTFSFSVQSLSLSVQSLSLFFFLFSVFFYLSSVSFCLFLPLLCLFLSICSI